MSDASVAMTEFRFLDEKRTQGSLSPAEEARWTELRAYLGDPGSPTQPAEAVDYAQQPQGYYGDDGQWYAYPAGYDPQQPQGYYGDDGQWYAYPAGYDPQQAQAQDPQAYAQQPQGYYGDDGQWYAYPAGYDPQQAQGYYGDDGQWYAYPAGYDPQQAQAHAEPILEAPPSAELTASPLEAEPESLDAGQPVDDVFEVGDTDLTPVSEAVAIPETPESVDMSDWEDTTSPSATALEPSPPAMAAAEPFEELGEDDFSSLNADAEPTHASSAPPVDEELLEHPQTLDIPATDISLLDATDGALQAEPVYAEEAVAPVSEEWASAPLAVDGAASAPPPTYDSWSEVSAPRSFDAAPPEESLNDADRMEVTASYALPAYPDPQPFDAPPETPAADEAPTFDVSELEAAPEPLPVDSAMETPWEASPYMAESAPVEEPRAEEQPTFDVSDLGAEVEPAAAAVEAPAEQPQTTLELHPVQVGPDLVADTVEVANSFDPEATRPSEWGTSEQTFDTGNPGDPVPLTSVSDYLGHNTPYASGELSDEPVPLEADARTSWMSGEAASTGETLQLQSAADFMNTPEFISASATWGHRPESEQPAAESSNVEGPYDYGTAVESYEASAATEAQPAWSAPADEPAPVEAQPEWAAPAEAQPVLEAQPEEAQPEEAQSEWAAPAEAQSVEAQPEWADPADAQPEEAQSEWAAPAEAQPVLEAQPEEAQPEWAAPAEAQPEWAAQAEAQSEWAAPAEAQSEWAAQAEAQPVLEAQTEWAEQAEAQPVLEAQPEWAAQAEAQPILEAQTEWAEQAEAQPVLEAQSEWAAQAEAQPVLEAQTEWAEQAEAQPVLEAQSEWAAQAEAQPVLEAQTEWAEQAEAQPVLEAQTEWAEQAEAQPVLEAQPEWTAPVETQAEWGAQAEEQPVLEAQPEWAAPVEAQPEEPQSAWASQEEWTTAEAQPEWATPVEELPAMEAQPEWATPAEEPLPGQDSTHWTAPAEPEWATDGATPQWGAQGEQAPSEWATPEPAAETATAPEWSDPSAYEEPLPEAAPAGDSSWASPIENDWNAPAAPTAWGQGQEHATPVEELSAVESDLPVMEAEPEPEPARPATVEFQDIDLEDIEEEAPAVVAPAPVAPPPAPTAPAPRSAAPPAPAPLPRAPTTPPVFAIPTAPAALVPGSPPPRTSRLTLTAVPPPPPAAQAPVASLNAFIEGEHRVIIHTVEGQVKRGAIRDVDLLDAAIPLEQQAGFAPESIAIQRVKAIFFMLATGSRPPEPAGQKIRVTFNDGRQVAGFSNDYLGTSQGFFVVPADTRTNTSRIFIYRSSVQAVAEG